MQGSPNPQQKRSLTIAGHRTSLSLEREFWAALLEAAKTENISLAKLVGQIDQNRAGHNLSSAIRIWLFNRVRQKD